MESIEENLTPNSNDEFDEGLAVPPSLSIINTEDNSRLSQFEIDSSKKNELVHLNTSVPYITIYNKPLKFKSPQRKVFIPGVEIKVKIINFERHVTSNLLSPILYTVHFSHGDFTWIIHTRYRHILNLHQQLLVYRATLNIPLPTKLHKERRESFRKNNELENEIDKSTSVIRKSSRLKIRSPALPRFPKKPEVLVTYDEIPKRMKQLEDYLYNLCNISIYRHHPDLIDFLEVSNLSFISDLGVKGKEGVVIKKAGSTLPGQTGCNCCGLLQRNVCNRCSYFCSSFTCGQWRKRWFFVKDTCFGYMCPSNGLIKSIMLFDQGFEVSRGIYSTGMNNGLQILNMNRQMIIKLFSKRRTTEWMTYLKTVADNQARYFTSPNLHHSFAPLRTNITAASFIDGSGYLSAVADCLEAAKDEIFITDWWLSPEIYMKRPVVGDYWRLDQILKRKAAQGVKIFILLYKEVEMALGINSLYSKSRLCYNNIKVLRHPDHAKAGVFLWAHHEKIVCIDQIIAFVGGIDLCYGRWDDYRHKLVDLGGLASQDVSSKPKTKKKTSSSPGGDPFISKSCEEVNPFNVPTTGDDESCKCDIESNKKSTDDKNTSFDHELIENESLPVLQPGDSLLMPTHSTLSNSNTVFLEDHYNPNFGNKKNLIDSLSNKSKNFLHLLSRDSPETADINEDEKERKKADKYAATNMNLYFPDPNTDDYLFKKTPLPGIPEDDLGLSINDISTDKNTENSKLWIGKDYANFIVKDFTNLDSPFVDLVDRLTTPRMPWHDIAMMVEGEAARDVARHFIQRWNAHKLEKAKKNMSYPYLIPKSYKNIIIPNILPNLEKHNISCQVLRSLCCWSGGFVDSDSIEQSIHEAYIEAITRAEHYIYIENQFFITNTSCFVSNQIAHALYNRILQAYKKGNKFRVFIIMPLLPAFEGEVGAPSGTSLHAITHWNYQSICRGEDSLVSRLKTAGIDDPTEFITFHGLRTHSVLENEPVTELIYVHSKLMIIDDRTVICGSANINDRSMLGKRDSEVAVLLQDEKFNNGKMNGQVYPSGNFAGSLRKRLFREHLGLIGQNDLQKRIDINDPVIDSFYRDIWCKLSQENTDIYEKVFHCIPNNSVKTFSELKKYQEDNKLSLWEVDPVTANNEIDKIQGFLVDFPFDFLADELLKPPSNSVIGMMPTSLWT